MGLILLPLLMFGIAAVVGLALFGILLRIAVRLLLLPLLLLKWIVLGVVLLVVAPILALVGAAVFLSAGLVLFVPLLPVLAVIAILWLLLKATRRPALI
jgi:hypothetical protein